MWKNKKRHKREKKNDDDEKHIFKLEKDMTFLSYKN